MKKNLNDHHKPVIIAAAVASFMMLFLGLGYRGLVARLAAPVDTAPIRPEVLQQLPLHIGSWMGQDILLDEDIVRATDTDAHVNRRYSRRNGRESVSLYIAAGVKARDLMPHRPEVCYTGAGWTLMKKQSLELSLPNGIEVPCNIMLFSRGALIPEKIIVLDYYLIDGQYCRDVSSLRLKAWRGSGTVDYVAQVQIVTFITVTQTAASAQTIISDFATKSASFVAELFKEVGVNRPSEKKPSDANSMHGDSENG